jgi:tRNA (cytidine/uridine-2'-O-)-methyltransferase
VFDIVLLAPEIPPNTGNVIRLAANTGARLHLVEPLGFSLDDRQLKRAGLDYHDLAELRVHRSWAACRGALGDRRLFALTTRGRCRYTAVAYAADDVFLFGPETRGLPPEILAEVDPSRRLRLPMRAANRSVNLSNAVAVVVFEAWRQLGFISAQDDAVPPRGGG